MSGQLGVAPTAQTCVEWGEVMVDNPQSPSVLKIWQRVSKCNPSHFPVMATVSYSAAQTQLDKRVRATRVTRNITHEYHLLTCASTHEWCTAHTRVETRECAGGDAHVLASTRKRTCEYSQTNSRVLANQHASTCKRNRLFRGLFTIELALKASTVIPGPQTITVYT